MPEGLMATDALGDEKPTLFLRKATGLVRGWSVPDSQLLTAVLISGVGVSFLVIAYSGLVVTIPRAGGDYVWQSRILGSGLGFVMGATGWGVIPSLLGTG